MLLLHCGKHTLAVSTAVDNYTCRIVRVQVKTQVSSRRIVLLQSMWSWINIRHILFEEKGILLWLPRSIFVPFLQY